MGHKLNQGSGRTTPVVIGNHCKLTNKKRCKATAFTYGGPGTVVPRRSSWRCTLVAAHDGQHATRGGHRTWGGPDEPFPPYVERFWPLTLRAWRKTASQERIDEIVAQYLTKSEPEKKTNQQTLF